MEAKALTPRQSHNIYVIKTFAILFVAFAHSTYLYPEVQHAAEILGGIGVPVFLLCSGFLFNAQEKGSVFWAKKLKHVIIPWIIYGTFTFIVSDRSFSLSGLLLWIVGYGTWLYYISFLLFYLVLFRAVRWKHFPYLAILMFVVSKVLDHYGLSITTVLLKTSYPNPFSRIAFFAVGVLLRRADCIYTEDIKKSKKYTFYLVFVIILLLNIIRPSFSPAYWVNFFYPWFAALALYYLADDLSGISCTALTDIGKQSYMIYFLHMQFGNGVSKLLFRNYSEAFSWVVLLLHPLIAVLSVYIGIRILRAIIIKLKMQDYMWIIGMK